MACSLVVGAEWDGLHPHTVVGESDCHIKMSIGSLTRWPGK